MSTNLPEFTIEKNQPIPSKSVTSIWPWHKLEIQDCLFVPVDDPKKVAKMTSKLSASANAYARRNNCKFTTRKVDGGIRIWRIK